MREVAWHMADFLAKSGEFKGVVDYAEMFASMDGESGRFRTLAFGLKGAIAGLGCCRF